MPDSTQTPSADTTAYPYTCDACARRFVVVGKKRDAGARCLCGAALTKTTLANGIYEIRRSSRAARKLSGGKRAPAAEPSAEIPREPDLGYGESHGYGPAHGGPSGPGDAPAPSAVPAPQPAPADDDASPSRP